MTYLRRGVIRRIQDILRGVGTCVVREGGYGTSRSNSADSCVYCGVVVYFNIT